MLGTTLRILIASTIVWGTSAQADIIYLDEDCDVADVTADGMGAADDCLGLYDKTTPGPGPNDSESFLNNSITVIDAGGSATAWGSEGAFGVNDWDFLGKDDFGGIQTFIDGSNGDPGEWEVDSALNNTFLVAIKQDNRLGLWLFEDPVGVDEGTFDYRAIFDSTSTAGGWSHISIYSSSTTVPEPGTLALLATGLLGFAATRRRSRAKARRI